VPGDAKMLGNRSVLVMQRLTLTYLVVVPVIVALLPCKMTCAESPYPYEHSYTFDVGDDSNVEVTCSITIHPGTGTWTRWVRSYGVAIQNFRAKDEASGELLQVDIVKSGTWTNCTVYFSKPQGEGYKFRVEFRAVGLVKKTTWSEFSLSWGASGGSKPLPQVVRIILPLKYDISSVSSDGKGVDYAKFVENGRIGVEFQGTAPENGYFRWEAKAQYVIGLVAIGGTTTIRITDIVERTKVVTTRNLLC